MIAFGIRARQPLHVCSCCRSHFTLLYMACRIDSSAREGSLRAMSKMARVCSVSHANPSSSQSSKTGRVKILVLLLSNGGRVGHDVLSMMLGITISTSKCRMLALAASRASSTVRTSGLQTAPVLCAVVIYRGGHSSIHIGCASCDRAHW